MAIVNATSLDQIDTKLARALSQSWLYATDLAVSDVSVPSSSGMSNETVLFRATWDDVDGRRRSRDLVARIQPAGPGIFPEYDVIRESRVMSALSGVEGLPIPRVLLAEPDPSVLGAPFVVMEMVVGRSPSDDPPFTAAGWVADLSPADRGTVCDQALQLMTRIHGLDWRALGLDFLDRPELGSDPLGQRLAWERRFYDWASQGRVNPLIEATFRWLDEHRPAGPVEPVLNWGDARISNIIYGDDLAPLAAVDFEVASLAAPEADLGWYLFTTRHHTDGIGIALPDGFPTVEQSIARYQQLSGRTVSDIDFYEVLAGLRGAIMMVRAARMLVDAGMLPTDTEMAVNNPASIVLAALVGQPVPTGETTSFIGNRG